MFRLYNMSIGINGRHAQYLLSANVRRYDSRFYRAAGLSVNQRRGRTCDPHLSSSLTTLDYQVDIRQGNPVHVASVSGDLGLMQMNRSTWRNLYDPKRMGGDIEYNGNSGGEILEYYLSRQAIRKNEDKQQEGIWPARPTQPIMAVQAISRATGLPNRTPN